MTISVVEGNEPPPAAPPWSVTVNGSYFNEAGTPVYHLHEGSRVFALFRKGANGVFWCRDGRCAIQHASDLAPDQPYDLALQSAPRLVEKGRPTKGVRGSDVVDGRAGLALAADGALFVFATAPLKWDVGPIYDLLSPWTGSARISAWRKWPRHSTADLGLGRGSSRVRNAGRSDRRCEPNQVAGKMVGRER
jgi:hypothetical protein